MQRTTFPTLLNILYSFDIVFIYIILVKFFEKKIWKKHESNDSYVYLHCTCFHKGQVCHIVFIFSELSFEKFLFKNCMNDFLIILYLL